MPHAPRSAAFAFALCAVAGARPLHAESLAARPLHVESPAARPLRADPSADPGAPHPSAALPPGDPGAPHVAPRVTPLLARGAVLAALRAARYPEKQAALRSMASRVRTSGVLPELWLRAVRTHDDSLSLTPTTGDPYHFSQVGGVGYFLEARLVWHLDRLVFDRDEVAVERLRAERSDIAGRLTNKVLEVLFAWQRALLAKDDLNLPDDDRRHAAISAMEAEVTLDVLTGGWFTETVGAGTFAPSSDRSGPE